MKKNFMNPEIKIESFDLGTDIVMLSSLTKSETETYRVLGVAVPADNGYVYSINLE